MVKQKNKQKLKRCAYCGTRSPVVWVHGHGQCSHCRINIEECCRGEQCELSHRTWKFKHQG